MGTSTSDPNDETLDSSPAKNDTIMPADQVKLVSNGHHNQQGGQIGNTNNMNIPQKPSDEPIEENIIVIFFLIHNLQLLPELATLIGHCYLDVHEEIMFLRFWFNNKLLKEKNKTGRENDWQINKDTLLKISGIHYSVIQSKCMLGKYPRHLVLNCYLGGDIWIGIAEKHNKVDLHLDGNNKRRSSIPFMNGFGWWQRMAIEAAFTCPQNGYVFKASPFNYNIPDRYISLYTDPISNKLYWVVDNILIYTHCIELKHNISEMYLTMCLHNIGDRISVVSSNLISLSTIADVLNFKKNRT